MSASATYLGAFLYLRKRKRTLNGKSFAHPKPRPIDRSLVVGSVIFGAGWGISGICPGPALVHLAFPNDGFVVFTIAMMIGFLLEARIKNRKIS